MLGNFSLSFYLSPYLSYFHGIGDYFKVDFGLSRLNLVVYGLGKIIIGLHESLHYTYSVLVYFFLLFYSSLHFLVLVVVKVKLWLIFNSGIEL